MYSFETATEQHRNGLITLYFRDIEQHQGRAQRFADDLIQKFNTILCLSEDDIVGTISWDTRGGLDDGIIELTAIGVSDEFRRKGIGSALVEQMRESAVSYFADENYRLRIVYLFMETGNDVARGFYRSLGFIEVGCVSKFYPHDDASIWVLRVE